MTSSDDILNCATEDIVMGWSVRSPVLEMQSLASASLARGQKRVGFPALDPVLAVPALALETDKIQRPEYPQVLRYV